MPQDEIGPTRLAVALRRVGLGRVVDAFGIGVHSDRQLKDWAISREDACRAAAKQAVGELWEHDREAARQLTERWPNVFR